MRSLTPEELDWIIAWLGEMADAMQADGEPADDISAVKRVRRLLGEHRMFRNFLSATSAEVNT